MAVADLVAIEPADEPTESRRSLRPGVDLQKSFRFWVGFRLERPPILSASVKRWTAPEREVGYWLVHRMEAAKDLPLVSSQTGYTEESPGFIKRGYRSLRSLLAARLVLPKYRQASEPAQGWEGTAPGFEASRRVIEFSQDNFVLVCHVFAPRDAAVADRLLGQFLETFSTERESWAFCDEASRLCLLAHSSFRFFRRHYWEIVIGPAERVADPEVDGEALLPIKVDFQMDEIGSALLDGAALDEMNARSALDWKFMSAEIKHALEAGNKLDDDFVEQLARQRFENAKEILAVEKPGPTLDSSREIAREMVRLYTLGLTTDAPLR